MPEATNTFVEILYPGSFMPEESVHKVKERDPERIAKSYPKAFCFEFYDVVQNRITVDGEEQTVSGKRKNKSGRYYPGATVFTTEDLKKLPEDFSILISNMECNGWTRVVRTRRGNFQPLEKGDHIL
jgi:hypothetical protein